MILGTREHAVLGYVTSFRLLDRSQIQSLVFPGLSRSSCDRSLARLEKTRLLVRWNMRRPGPHGGATLVYKRVGRKVIGIPDHTLAIGDVFVTLKELEREGKFQIDEYQTEPGHHGIRPDLHVRLTAHKAVQLDFEADLGTEGLSQVRGKLQAVCESYRIVEGVDVWPLTIWVTRDAKRAAAIKALVAETPEPALFRVATFDTLKGQLS